MNSNYTERAKKRFTSGIQEVADYLMTHPEAMRRNIVAIFSKKYNKGGRTIDRWIKEAREINEKRSDEIIRRNEEIINGIVKDTKEAICTRVDTLVFLSSVINGKVKKTDDDEEEAIQPNFTNRLTACQLLSKMCGWDSPEKKEVAISNVAEMTDEQLNDQLNEFKEKIK